MNGLKPTVGHPNNIFKKKEFASQEHFVVNVNDAAATADKETFSQDVISCNGVIHVVDEVLLPGGSNAFRNGPPSSYYGASTPNYYGGYSHTHGYYGHQGYGPGSYYYQRGRNSGAHYKAGKKDKKNKGSKGIPAPARYYGGYGGYQSPYYNSYNGGVFRKLDGDDEADAYEMPMSDAEFFGTSELVQNEVGESAEEDLSNRKRRLEAMLEPDGNIAQV